MIIIKLGISENTIEIELEYCGHSSPFRLTFPIKLTDNFYWYQFKILRKENG